MRAALSLALLLTSLAHAASVTIEIRGYIPPRTGFFVPDGGRAEYDSPSATWSSNEGATTYDTTDDAGTAYRVVEGP